MPGGAAQFLGNTVGEAAAFAAGLAISPLLHPVVQSLQNEAWSLDPTKPLDAETAATLVAQGAVLLNVGEKEAHLTGISAKRFAELHYLALRAPDLAITLELWRRGLFGDPTSAAAIKLVDHALDKEQIEDQYRAAIKDLFSGRLDPALIATMVQRSVLANATNPDTGEAILPVSASDAAQRVYDEWNASTRAQLGSDAPTGSNVTPMPQVGLDPITEARAHGIDFDRLAAEARIVGLPASPDLAARMVFRQIATPKDFVQALAEGNARIEWAPALFNAFREILTANQYAELELRGFLKPEERLAHTLKHGMSKEDSDLLYNLLGRSIPEHQITTGEARGGVFEGPIDTIPRAYLQSLQRGNLRPEYYNLAYHNRYSYPSAFFFRILIQGGDITAAEGEQAFLEIGWSPKWAKLIADALAKKTPAAAKGNPWVAKAEQHWWTEAQKAFIKTGTPRSVIEPVMQVFVPNLADRDAIFQWWTDTAAVAAGVPPA